MDSLKKRVLQTRQEVEKAEIKEKFIRKLLRRQGERVTRAEMEAEELRNRKSEMENQIARIKEKTYKLSLGLQAKNLETDDSEKDRKGMECKEFEHSDQIALLEDRVSDVVRVVEEKEIKLEEAKQRFNETSANLKSALARALEYESKAGALEDEVQRTCKELYLVERKTEKRMKKNDYLEDKIEDMDFRRRSAILRSDDLQLEAKRLQNQADKLSDSLSRQKKRVAFMKRELDDAQADLNIARN